MDLRRTVLHPSAALRQGVRAVQLFMIPVHLSLSSSGQETWVDVWCCLFDGCLFQQALFVYALPFAVFACLLPCGSA